MSFGLGPIQLIVLSGLLQDKGLRIPPALTTRIDKLKDQSKLLGRAVYIGTHPQQNESMTIVRNQLRQVPGLSGSITSSYSQSLPEAVRVYDVPGSILVRAENLLGNGLKGVLENLIICSGALQNSFNVQASLDTYRNVKFSDLYLNATNYTDVLSHGLTSSFGSTARGTPAQLKATDEKRTVTVNEIKQEVTQLSTAVKNLGDLYDWSDLNTVGTPQNLIKNIYKIGAAYNTEVNNLMSTYGYNVDTLSSSDTIGLTQLLQRIVGKDIAVIIRAAKTVPPDIRQIDSAADFLQASKVLPLTVANMLPNRDLTQLGKKLTSLGVNSTNIDEILTALGDVKIIDLPKLKQLTQPVPKFDANVIERTLITGQGQFNAATLDDLLGSLSGNYYYEFLDQLIATNDYFTKNETALFNAITTIYNKLKNSQTVGTVETSALTAEVTSFNSKRSNAINQWLTNVTNSERAVLGIVEQLKREIRNGELIGVRINSNLQVTTSNTTIDSFDIRNIRKAVYSINVQNNNRFDDFEAKVVHNGSVANLTVYNRGLVGTETALGNVYCNVNVAANTCTVSYATSTDNSYNHYLRSSVEYTVIGDGSSPNALQGSSAELNTVYQLDEIAVDSKFIGIGALLESMVTDDIYGEALLASLETSRNTKKLEAIGINGKKADPLERLTEVLAKQGHGLTESQRRQIITAAQADGTDPNLAIANASRHGFFSDYYSKKGNFG
jgi:hypothetical protein